ncbi:hypothetical protein AB0M02_25195 [Actinoplanes sp. NPDC051861]|uniref:SecDF P1 head subdomain-containing protein n=1 Tax=Actinoplanes sp. NPDC051861 TaxID=3155170 RepID=UPI00343AFC8F
MAAWNRLGKAGIAVAMVLVLVVIGLVGFSVTRDRADSLPPLPAVPSATPRDLSTPISVQVIKRIGESACKPGDGGVPGPGNGGDWCYFLDEGFVVTRANLVDLYEDMDGELAVTVRLQPADREPFAAWSAQAVGNQIAIRVADRVLEAPHVETPLSGDSVDFSTLSEAETRDLYRQLWE